MVLDGIFGNIELAGNFLIAFTGSKLGQDIFFPRG